KIYHIIEIVRMAMGEKLNYPEDHVNRAWDIIVIITYSLLLSFLKKNFYIKQITYDEDLSTFKPKKYNLLKLMRYLMNFPFMKSLFAKGFQLLRKILKSD
ncbi:MAG: hypothetical protein P8Y23_02025, partial [Candidatus Lokiarchaeota archaeon]